MAGLFYEEFSIGQEFDHPWSRTVTEMDNTLFSALTLNVQPLHLDAHFAAQTEFGQRLVNSMFTAGLMVGMTVNDTTAGTTIGNLGFTEMRFPKPVFHGDTLKARTKVLSMRESKSRPDAGIIEFEHSAWNQRDEMVAICRRQALMKKKGQGAPPGLCPRTPLGPDAPDPHHLSDGFQGVSPWRGLGQSPNLASMKRITFSADDFGLSECVNEAVERAHRDGILTAASLMVAGPAAADAIRRAHALPGLRVGLHLVVIEGPAILPPASIPDLVDATGQFPSDQLRLGVAYFFRPRVRRQLAAEIRAQYAAFAASGLKLDHANAHKHMHLHPTVGRLMLDIGRDYGLRAIRVPAEPPAVLERCGTRVGLGDHALYHWTALLRRQARAAGMATTDHCFGLAWSGHMTADRVRRLMAALPEGTSEVYFHPATARDATLRRLMPDYEHEAELATLLDRGLLAGTGQAGEAHQMPDG